MAAKVPDSITVMSVGNKKLTVGHFQATNIDDGDTWDTGLSSVNSLEKNSIWTAQTSTGPTDFQVAGVSGGILTFDSAANIEGHVFILSDDY